MKNSVLLVLLIALLGLAYVLEEYIPKRNLLEEKTQHSMIKLNRFERIDLKNVTIIKENNNLRIMNTIFPISNEKMAKLVEALSNIRIIKKIENNVDDEAFIKEIFNADSLSFTVTSDNVSTVYTIGSEPSLTGHFYVSRQVGYQAEFFLCRDDSLYDGVYQSQEDVELKRFYRLYQLLSSQLLDFVEPLIFPSAYFSKVKVAEIKNNRNRFYQVNFHNKSTIPEILQSMNYNERYFLHFLQEFQQMKLKNIYENKNALDEMLAEVTFDRNLDVRLYKKYSGKEGYFISFSDSLFVFEIGEYQAKLFFSNVQDFWDKKLTFLSKIDNLKNFEFFITFFESSEEKKYLVRIVDDKNLNLEVIDHSELRPVREKFVQLIKILFSIDNFFMAERVEPYTHQFYEENKKFREIRLGVQGRNIDLYFAGHEIILANVTDGHLLYYRNTENLIFGNTIDAFFKSGYQ
ncbi:MAG: hypothetical protein JNM93_02320 [Bacteriovoracaceae bacterium]|nr:hypothetical protein [Bacteriovoracaceae bacterium]